MIAEKNDRAGTSLTHKVLNLLYFLLVLYLFFLCIELMGSSFKLFGKDFAKGLLNITENPIVGLLLGILATSIMQSSSSTTSIVVGMVAAGLLTVENAVPIVMGANIGTTITNSVVSVGHVQRKVEFQRAFAGATVHDFFNICTVILFLPLEFAFGPIQHTAEFIADHVVGLEGAEFKSPLKAIVKPAVELLENLGHTVVASDKILAVLFLVIALALLIFTLSRIVSLARGAMAEKLELVVDKYLFTGTFRGLFIGIFVTVLVQSSSVTTSLVIPLLGAGIVRLETVFPYMVGANIGTTITALLAAMVTGDISAVTIAICHFVFNIFGTAVFLPLRKIPIGMAKWLGERTAERRWIAIVYIGVAFFLIPGLLILLMRLF